MRSIASVSVGYTAPAVAPEHRRAEQDRVGLGRDCDGNAERVRVRVPPTRVRGRAAARDEQTRCGGPVEASASTMWRDAYASACSAARYQRARSSTSSRSCTPASAPRELRIGERRTVAEDARLPVAVDGHSRRVTVGSEPVEDAVERGERIVAERALAPGCIASTWSRNAPDAEIPASVHHMPGRIAS